MSCLPSGTVETLFYRQVRSSTVYAYIQENNNNNEIRIYTKAFKQHSISMKV